MRKSITVTVLGRTPDTIHTRLSDHHNERTGERLPDATVTLGRDEFLGLAADHGLAEGDFPTGVPVRVSEPA